MVLQLIYVEGTQPHPGLPQLLNQQTEVFPLDAMVITTPIKGL